jgi:hypothetical protein
MAYTCDDPVDLLAGQSTDVGSVTVCNDETNLYVTFTTTGSDYMRETHLAVETSSAAIPQTKKFNPVPGQFEYSTTHSPVVQTFTYTIPKTWDTGMDLYIAAHASLDKEETLAFSSDADGKTLVTAGNVPAAVYPYAVVDAWEAFGDPADATPSLWDSSLTPAGLFTSGDWIWESYRVVDPTVPQSVTFEHTFTVPGEPTSGTLWIADDNQYEASLNGAFVGSQTIYGNWMNVGTYPISAITGENTLQVIGTNYGDGTFTPDNNPAGLIFRGEVKYLLPSETAWGNGIQFAGANWATYFVYTVHGCAPVETVTVPSNGDVVSSATLTSGAFYRLDASETYRFANWGDQGIADAECSYRTDAYLPPAFTPRPGWISGDALTAFYGGSIPAGASWLEVSVNDADVNWNSGANTCDTTDHTYSAEVTGTGSPATFKIYDDGYTDNSGSITVAICRVW